MANPFAPNVNGMMQKMVGGMVQNAMGNLSPLMQMMANPAQLEQQYREFRQQYQGDPEEDLRRMLQEGTISEQQIQKLMAMTPLLPKV